MTESSKVGKVDVVRVVGAREEANFSVVHVVGDHLAYLVGCVTSTNVLSIASTASSTRKEVFVSL